MGDIIHPLFHAPELIFQNLPIAVGLVNLPRTDRRRITPGSAGYRILQIIRGVFGIATKYSEALLAVKYRVKTKDGRMQGGAMYALERGLHMKWLGVLFAVFGGFASFGIGCATQVNAIAAVCEENLGIPSWIVGVAVCILTACVIFGGIRSIARVCEKLVPFMAIFYVAGCLIILVINWDFLLPRTASADGTCLS